MRWRLAFVGLATTALVVIALLVPLALLVQRQAADEARLEAERAAQSTASLVALALTLEERSLESALGEVASGVVVATSGGAALGAPLQGQGSLIDEAFDAQATIAAEVDGGWELALPVIGREDVVVVDVFVPNEALRDGVGEAWMLLGLLGVVLIGASAVIGDRLGRWLVAPIGRLTAAAHRLAEGDLEARVVVDEPPELGDVADAFNTLAARLDVLLAEEREAVADLSHRLRTPLTSLRLQAERIVDDGERSAVLSQVERLEHAIDELIVSARARGEPVGQCLLDEVVAVRLRFWEVLADEQGRAMSIDLGAANAHVGLAERSLQTVLDSLVGNVFSHTPDGVGFEVSTGRRPGASAWLRVSDDGPGFEDEMVIERGVSGAGSTGLGLDITRRTAELAGGSLRLDDRPGGGAVVTVYLGDVV